MSDAPLLCLVDGTAQLFRAYFAIRGLTGPNGQPTNALYGFTAMLRKMLVDRRPAEVAVAFDLPGATFRHDRFPEYKANRPPAPEDLNAQVPTVPEICRVLGVRYLTVERYEADDIIATLARRGKAEGRRVLIVSSDKDLMQLVDDDVTMFDPGKERTLDPRGVAETFGVEPGKVLDVLSLMGDSVDNIPGVPGVGEKTALEMVRTHGTLDAVVARAERFAAMVADRDALVEAVGRLSGDDPLGSATVTELLDARDAFVVSATSLAADEVDEAYAERVREAAEAAGAVDPIALRNQEGLPAKKAARHVRGLKATLKGLDRGSGKRSWLAVAEHAGQARMSREVASLHFDVPLDLDLDDLAVGEPDREAAHRLFLSLGFRRLTEEFSGEAQAEAGEPAPAEEAVPARTLFDAEALDEVIGACRAAGSFALDTETDGVDPMRARLVGLSMAWAEGESAYLPVGHRYEGCPEQLGLDAVRERLAPLLADAEVAKVGQNLKYDTHVLRRHGMPVAGWRLDTMVAAFLLDAGKPSFSMDRLALEYLGHETIKYEEVAGKGAKRKTLDEVAIERVAAYAAEDADVTWRLAKKLEPLLEERGLASLYRELDGPLLPVLAEMEAVGIALDTGVLEAMSAEMEQQIDALRERIHGLAGEEFNVDSPKQLREVLFDRLGLRSGRKTAKGGVASTDAQTLETLVEQHEIAGAILEYRELTKLKGTYVDTLPKLVHPEDGRIHTSYHPTGAATGRLSSSDPNLQNIPARTEAGRAIRAAFVAGDGRRFLASDYSQVELRVLAHMAEDEELIRAFRAGEDIHRYTASRVFDVPAGDVTPAMRGKAKAVNFGILYGMSETRLAREQGMSRQEAHEFIEAYFGRFGAVRDYIDGVRETARRDAAVRTLFGRVRPFPQLHQRVHRGIQEQALRAAVNTTIQGTAADLMKRAMLDVHAALREAEVDARMLLQVHDELVLEVAVDDVDRVSKLVRRRMEGVAELSVPLAVDQKVGDDWREVT